MRKLRLLSVVSTVLGVIIVLSFGTFAFASRDGSTEAWERVRPTTRFNRASFNIPTLPPRPTFQPSYRRLSPTPTFKISSAPTPTLQQNTPTPIPTKSASVTSTPIPTSPVSGDLVRDFIMNAINDYRKSQGLTPVSTDPYTCGFAATRAHEIVSNFDHSGFTTRINSKTLPYPSYAEITENLAMTSNYREVVTLWINSAGHAENMRKNTPYVCVAYDGNYYAYEGWRP